MRISDWSSDVCSSDLLNVTQGAISRQVRLLEDYLGTALFTRTTREINLTASGTQYYESIRDTLQQIAQATAGMRHWQGAQQVTVVTSTAMASLWLLPDRKSVV